MSLFNHWRFVLLTLVAIGVLGGFAACGGGEENASPAASTGGAAARIKGGTLTVHNVEFQSTDPHYSNFAQDISLERMLWRGLYSLDKDNVPQPAMADGKPQVSADGKTYTINVKSGLKWSDGQPLTAKDFELAVLRTCNPDNAGQYESFDSNIVGCDDYFGAKGTTDQPKTPTAAELEALKNAVGVKATGNSIEFKLGNAQPTFPILLAMWTYMPVPSHLLPDPGEAWPTPPSAKLAYNGPYMVTEYVKQDHINLAPNPNWSGDIKPTLDKLVVKFIEDFAVADRAYEAGELDEAEVDTGQLATIKSKFGADYLQTLQPSTRGLEMEVKHTPLDKLEVRLALSQAIDRVTLNQVAAGGANVPTTTMLPAVTSGPDPGAFESTIGYNPTKAKENLSKAGFPGGAGFPKLNIVIRDSATPKAVAQFLQKNFKDILGIDIDIQTVDGPTRSKRFNTHDFDLFPGGWIQDYPDPEDWVGAAGGLFNTVGGNNGYECSDPKIDDLINKAQFNTNESERIKQYQDVNELVSTTICGIAPYWHETNNWLVKPYIVGMKENTAGQDASMPGDWLAEAWGRSK